MNSAGFGYFIAFISMFIGSLSLFPFTDAARKWGPVAVNHFRLIAGFIILSVICMFSDNESPVSLFTSPSLNQYLLLGTSGIIGLALGDYFGFHSMAILGAKRASIFYTLDPGAALFFGYMILNEHLDITGITGIVISMGGMIWFIEASSTKELDKHTTHEYGKISKGIFFGILSGICQGFHMALSKKGLLDNSHPISFIHATWLRVFAATLGYCLLTFIRGKFRSDVIQPIRSEKGIINKAFLATVFGLVVSVTLVMWCLTMCKIAVAQTILSMGPIIIIPAAYFLYKEKMTSKIIAAAGVSIIGVVVLIWRDEIARLL